MLDISGKVSKILESKFYDYVFYSPVRGHLNQTLFEVGFSRIFCKLFKKYLSVIKLVLRNFSVLEMLTIVTLILCSL